MVEWLKYSFVLFAHSGVESGFERTTAHTGSTQPFIPPGSINRVPTSVEVMAGTTTLPGGR